MRRALLLIAAGSTLACSRSLVLLAPGDGAARSHEVDVRVAQGEQTQVNLECASPARAQKIVVSWDAGVSFGGKKVHVSYWCAVDEHPPGGLE